MLCSEQDECRNVALVKSRAQRKRRAARQAEASQAKADAIIADLERSGVAIEAGEAVTPKRKRLVRTHGDAWRRFVVDLKRSKPHDEICPVYGPTTRQVSMYAAYMFKRRVNYSTAGKEGLSNSYKHQVRDDPRRARNDDDADDVLCLTGWLRSL